MRAIILAAGEGKRLRPFTETRPKPMFQVLGVSVIQRLLDSLSKHGVTEFHIVVSYMADVIIEHLSNTRDELALNFVDQGEARGTGHALAVAMENLEPDWTIVLNGDILVSDDAIAAATRHCKAQHALLTAYPVDHPERYGVFSVAEQKRYEGLPIAVDLVEKPNVGESPSNLANVGIYVFPPSTKTKLNSLKTSERGELEITDAVKQEIIDGTDFALYTVDSEVGYWFDLGTPWSILEASGRLLELEPEVREGNVEPGVHLHGKVVVKEGARIRSGVYIEGPVLIDTGADVGPNCYVRGATYLGKDTRVGNACEVKNSVIMAGTHVGHLSYVGDSVLDEGVNFGAGTITANLRLDKKTIQMELKGIKEDSSRRKLGVFVGKNVQVGICANFMPGVIIGSDTYVGSNALVHKNIGSKTVAYTSDQLQEKQRATQ